MNLGIRLAITVSLAVTAAYAGASEQKTVWTMALSVTRVEEPSSPIFDVWAINYEEGELIAFCEFANTASTKYRPVKVVVEGQWRDGSFWPVMKAQVGDVYSGPWYSIRFGPKQGKVSKIEVLPGEVMPKWRVRLNDFLPYVGNYAVGRIVLTSGDSATFDLINLKGESKESLAK